MFLRGRGQRGVGDLSHWMALHADAYAAAAGTALYPGSLNLALDAPWALPSERITLTADEVGRDVYLVPCSVQGRPCFVFRTRKAEAAGGPERRVLEIVSSVCLRRELGIDDGDLVEVTLPDDLGGSENVDRGEP